MKLTAREDQTSPETTTTLPQYWQRAVVPGQYNGLRGSSPDKDMRITMPSMCHQAAQHSHPVTGQLEMCDMEGAPLCTQCQSVGAVDAFGRHNQEEAGDLSQHESPASICTEASCHQAGIEQLRKYFPEC